MTDTRFPEGWEEFRTERGIGISKVVKGELRKNAVLGDGPTPIEVLRAWAEEVENGL